MQKGLVLLKSEVLIDMTAALTMQKGFQLEEISELQGRIM